MKWFVTVVFLSICINCFAQGIPFSYDVENRGADCPAPPLPSFSELPAIKALPDPFAWSDSSRGRINSYDDWRCRRAEIGVEIQHYELGNKPAAPNILDASFSGSTLSVAVGVNGDTLSLTARVTLPEGEGPFPAVIGIGFTGTGSLPSDIFISRRIAAIQYDFAQLAPAGFGNIHRGDGGFYELYSNSEAGFFAAWAWGVSRIIDGLEQTSGHNIDVSRLAVTGCSFAGKIALFSGAFDERIALTIAQEPGGGGDAAWRVTEALEGKRETLSNAQGAPWYRENFSQFNEAVTKLPYDHHELMAMVAPRALLILGNPDYEWLAEESGYIACMAAREVWKALDVSGRFGFSKVGGHEHCRLPESQVPEVAGFVEKFLLGNENANTDITRSPYDFNLSDWITWETPALTATSTYSH